MSKLYQTRDLINQGMHYTKHVCAMTSEELHSKSDIAAELAHRDIKIDALIEENKVLRAALSSLLDDSIDISERVKDLAMNALINADDIKEAKS